MSQERTFGNSGVAHRSEPNHSQPTEEVTIAASTSNRFWRMMIDPGFPSPASNPALFVVTTEAFLGLTNQVQALAGMVQTIVPYLSQLIQSSTQQSASPTTFPQTESLVAPNRETQLEAESPQRQVAEAHTASPTAAPAQSQSRSCDSVQTNLDFDTLSSDIADSLREQVRQVHQRLDEVQKEVLKSRGEIGESSKGDSSFTPEIQDKPLPATFRLPTLKPYDGSGDPTEHIAAFRAQMALYDMSDALMCWAFLTTLRGPTRTWFFWSLIERSLATLPEMLQRVHQYIATETLVAGNGTSRSAPGWSNPEDTPRRHRRGGRTRRACCHQDPPDSPQFDSTRNLLPNPGEGPLEGSKPNEVTLRETRQKEVLSLS
ncbi:hypothetical protein BHM03_00030903 [Ensete ventricosum]|uniref:Retrotransposon gag domain-containing protein n=1 Tax=Ensete ventricosum TaxID=4639 RepID=A0A445MIH4_ENSVE|nr:hypothetical protein BHM03_00030903 [Ensete ventricosum]